MEHDGTALEALQLWLIELANQGRSPRTVAAYETDVTEVVGLVASQLPAPAPALGLSALTRDRLMAAIAEFRTRPDPRYRRNPHQAPPERARATVARKLAAVRSFLSWCYQTGRIPADPAALLRAPRAPKRLPKALEAEVAERALRVAEDSRWPERDLAIVVLALTTGLRLAELASLGLDNLVGTPPEVFNVVGKGNKERRLPLAPIARDALIGYLPSRRQRLAHLGLDARSLFISSRTRPAGRDRDGAPVLSVEATRAGIAYVIERVLRKVGARRRGSRVHVLRHTFATLGLRPDPVTGIAAYTLRQLQAALGHANLATIQVYTEVSDAELVRAAAAHPLARSRRSPILDT